MNVEASYGCICQYEQVQYVNTFTFHHLMPVVGDRKAIFYTFLLSLFYMIPTFTLLFCTSVIVILYIDLPLFLL